MAKGTVVWNSIETWQRLVASMVASGGKPDLKKTAVYYGTTYHTLENKFRIITKEANELKAEIDGNKLSEGTPARPKSAPTTPCKPKTPRKDPLETVANGRVTKKTPKKGKEIKQEHLIDGNSFNFDDLHDSSMGSFDQEALAFNLDGNVFH